jgi:magnesium transporter
MIVPQLDADLGDTVNQHMRREFACLRLGQTMGQALDWLRANPPGGPVIYFYVVDDQGRLQGVVPTRRLLLNALDVLIDDIMVKQVIAIPETATVLEACEFFTLHRLLAFPVVDQQRRILGVVDVELYTEELSDLDASERSDELFQLIGVHLAEAQQGNALWSFRQRFPWLLCNIGGGILAAFLAAVYEAELERVVALALFIPVVLALAESVSIQSVSLALQTLRGVRPTWRELLVKIRRELLTGVFLGGACGLIVGMVALVWLRHLRVMFCLLGGVAGGVAGAAVFGLTIPYLLRLLRRDPQVAAGPIALASTDIVTLLIYFNMAWLLL